MLTEEHILNQLDNFKFGVYCRFIDLGHPYSYLINSRLNVFKDNGTNWAIVAERAGYNPRGGGILTDIFYFGNCLQNLDTYNEQLVNYYTVSPMNWDEYIDVFDFEYLREHVSSCTIRGRNFELSHNKHDYDKAGIELKNYFEYDDAPDKISVEEVGRLLLTKYMDVFLATDDELYRSIPKQLKKLLTVDEWHHKDFQELFQPQITDINFDEIFNSNKQLSDLMDSETFRDLFTQHQDNISTFNQQQWTDNRPSSYETWQLLAKVIVSGDASLYKPTLEPNSHWKNWPESGSL